jgi:hypothetical protein
MSFWHAYGMVATAGELEGAWLTLVVGPTELPYAPADMVNLGSAYGPRRVDDHCLPDLPYLCTWDHEPSDEEKASLEPNDVWLSRRIAIQEIP